MDSAPEQGAQPSSRKRTLILVLTNLVSLASLIWALHDMNLTGIKEALSLDWSWVTVAVISDVAVFVWQGWRWALLLTPVAPVSWWSCVRAIYVGLFSNEVLPFRPGEVIRCYLQAHWSEIPFSVTLASVVVERISDGIWLVLCVAVVARTTKLPASLAVAAYALLALVAVGIVLAGFGMFYRRQAHQALSSNRIWRKAQIVIDDLHLIGHSRFLYFAFFASLPYLLLQVLPIYALMQADGFDFTIGRAFTLMVMLRIISWMPQAPGNLGTFQAVAKLGMEMFGVNSHMAASFAMILWSVTTLPLLVAGAIALAVTGMNMGDIHRNAHGQMRREPATEMKA